MRTITKGNHVEPLITAGGVGVRGARVARTTACAASVIAVDDATSMAERRPRVLPRSPFGRTSSAPLRLATLPFRDVTPSDERPQMTSDTATLGHELFGVGTRGVLVLNDWLSDTSSWTPTRPYLDRDRFTWAFTDLRGYGRSRGRNGSFTIEETSADVLALADALGWSYFDVIGHSMSTLVALQLAQQHPERVRSAVLVTPISPAGSGYDAATVSALCAVARGDDEQRSSAISFLFEGRLPTGWLRFKVAQWRDTSDSEAVAAYLPALSNRGLPDRTSRVARPVLAITGEQDVMPLRRDATAASLAPLCESLVVEAIADSGHYPMQETPPLFVAKVEWFLLTT